MSEGMNIETLERIEALKGEVIAQLQRASAAQLTEICVEISVVIPPRKAGIKSALANLVVLLLSSPAIEESNDYGEQMIMDLKQKLDQRLGPRVVEVLVSGEVKVDPEVKPLFSAPTPLTDQANSSSATLPNATTAMSQQNVQVAGGVAPSGGGNGTVPIVSSRAVTGGTPGVSFVANGGGMIGALGANGGGACAARSGQDGGGLHGVSLGATAGTAVGSGRMVHRLKEFKIHSGTIGGENQLSMDDLLYQIDEGQASGYGIREIVSAVIRATKLESSLRAYWLTRKNLTYESLVSLIRSHYRDKEEMRKMK